MDLDRLVDRLDTIVTHLHTIDKTLVRQEENLRDHMRRTELAENRIEAIQEHVSKVNGLFKAVGFISVITGILYTLLQISGVK